MMGKEGVAKVLDKVMSFAKDVDLEANLSVEDFSLTRFYDNHIHQNLKRENHVLTVRVAKGKRTGAATVNLLDDGSLRWAVQTAVENMEMAGEDPQFPGLPKPRPYQELSTYVTATANAKPKDRADGCGVAIDLAKSKGLKASGTFHTAEREFAVANTAGVRAYNVSTDAFFRTIMEAGPNTGYADRLSRDVRDIDTKAVSEEALEKATLYPESVVLEPGRYDTIFEEYALADLIRFLGSLAFGAQAKQQGRSFMAYSMGKKVMSDNVTIWDDGNDLRGLAAPFDAEGVPKQKVMIIDKGVAKGVVYDSRSAGVDGLKSTGHAGARVGRRMGPVPSNMFMAPGESTKDEMIKSSKRGLLVTRFHYTHCPEPTRVVATGTTRDGTFLIENGQIVARVKNLRFTESIIEAFARIEALSKTTRLTRDWWSSFTPVLPCAKIKDFTFTGTSMV